MKKYTKDQQRVADYISEATGHSIGGGSDPIGFLIASHASIRKEIDRLEDELDAEGNNCVLLKNRAELAEQSRARMEGALRYWRDECSGSEPSLSVFERKVDEALSTPLPAPHATKGNAMPKVDAPWTPEQVDHLFRYQYKSGWHPFTCGGRGDGKHGIYGGDEGILIPTVRGWICPYCDYTQNWAHAHMTSGRYADPTDLTGGV